MAKTSVVIPNWNGAKTIIDCLESMKAQNQEVDIIIVDNGSTDDSVETIRKKFPEIVLIELSNNLGFAGGVNAGIKKAIEGDSKYIALFNNDAVAERNWLKSLVNFMEKNPGTGIAASKILNATGEFIDSTGEAYTIWGLPFPRGRGETDINRYDNDTEIFGASGGASIYRVKMLQEIGLFDEDFFAYYEDVDLSFRAQLAGWKVAYVPKAVVYHQIGTTSTKVKDFTTYQTLKNLPWLLWKNVPLGLLPKIWPRLVLVYIGIAVKALIRGQLSAFFKGIIIGSLLLPKKFLQRYQIQRRRKVSVSYIDSIITRGLPPNARSLSKLRSFGGK